VVVLSLALTALMLPAASLAGQGIEPTVENGRTVWTNDTPTEHTVRPVKEQLHPLYYWDEAQKMWLPVKATSEQALRSAEKVAGEVNHYIESQPRLGEEKPHGLAGSNPNYAKAAAGRKVSAEDIDRFIHEAAARHKVNPNLVRAGAGGIQLQPQRGEQQRRHGPNAADAGDGAPVRRAQSV